MKPLIFIPSVRDLPEVKEAVNKLPHDTLWVKYMNQDDAYKTGRDFFLNNDHTHFIINPDDLIVTEDQINWLLAITSQAVISGWCVHGKTEKPREGLDTNISFDVFKGDPHTATYEDYNFIPIEEVDKMEKDDMLRVVGFAGFAPTIIPRKILEVISFRTSEGCCVDSCFAQDLDRYHMIQFVDFRIKTTELKAFDLDVYGHLGKKEPRVIFNGSDI